MSKKVYVVGSTNQDIVIQLDRRPAAGETVFGNTLSYFQGGKGANQAVACHKSGASTLFVSTIGNDAFGNALKQELEQNGLTCRLTISATEPTGTAIIDVDKNGENAITVISGANRTFHLQDIERALHDSSPQDILLLQNELAPERLGSLVQLGKEKQMITVVNVAPAVDITAHLAFVDYLILNEHEIEITLKQPPLDLTDISQAIASTKALSEKIRTNLIVTLGDKGAIACTDGMTNHINGHHVNVVDTTGAGDCFCGIFAGCLSKDMPIDEALTYANSGAALSVQSLGASTSYPTEHQILAMSQTHHR